MAGFLATPLALITLFISLHWGTAVGTAAGELGADDLIALGVFKTTPSTAGKGGSGTVTERQQALLLAAAKTPSGSRHGSVPYLLVDVDQEGGPCGPYDWIFRSDCDPPRTDTKIEASRVETLRNSFLYAYLLPNGWENLRVTLPADGRCGRDGSNPRTAYMRMATPSALCMRARFRYRSCSFWRCTLKECDPLVLVARLITVAPGAPAVVKPYVASDNGIDICPTSSITDLFLK